jgi:serine protease Do
MICPFSGEFSNMSDAFQALSRRVLPLAAAVGFALAATPALARGPDGIADVAEKVIDAVVNISTSQTVEAKNNDGDKGSDERGNRRGANPQLPPDSPFSEFFDEFFKNRRGGPGGGNNSPRKVNSLGSGFIIDAERHCRHQQSRHRRCR